MPAEAMLTDLGREMLASQPSWFREDPDNRAVIHAHAKEMERADAQAQSVRDNLIAERADELGLPWWEYLLRTTEAPEGLTVTDRRARVLSVLLAMTNEPAGSNWEAAGNRLIGPSWTYDEEDPYTIRLTVPWAAGSPTFLLLERRLREFTPAHLDLIVGSEGGFILDESQLDQEPFHPS